MCAGAAGVAFVFTLKPDQGLVVVSSIRAPDFCHFAHILLCSVGRYVWIAWVLHASLASDCFRVRCGVRFLFLPPLLRRYIDTLSLFRCTYPLDEEVSGGLLMISGNFVSIGVSSPVTTCFISFSLLILVCAVCVQMIFLLDALIGLRSTYTNVYTPASYVIPLVFEHRGA